MGLALHNKLSRRRHGEGSKLSSETFSFEQVPGKQSHKGARQRLITNSGAVTRCGNPKTARKWIFRDEVPDQYWRPLTGTFGSGDGNAPVFPPL